MNNVCASFNLVSGTIVIILVITHFHDGVQATLSGLSLPQARTDTTAQLVNFIAVARFPQKPRFEEAEGHQHMLGPGSMMWRDCRGEDLVGLLAKKRADS